MIRLKRIISNNKYNLNIMNVLTAMTVIVDKHFTAHRS